MNSVGALLQSDMSAVVVIPIALAMFTLIVFVHELGHFAAAQRLGVHVRDFAIGFPPTIWSRFLGGQMITALLLGGELHNRISGPLKRVRANGQAMDVGNSLVLLDEREPCTPALAHTAAESGARAVIVIGDTDPTKENIRPWSHSIPIVAVERNFIRPLLQTIAREMVSVELSLAGEAKRPPGEFPVGSLRFDATRFAINSIPLGGYVRMRGESEETVGLQVSDPTAIDNTNGSPDTSGQGSFIGQSPRHRALILLAGPIMNFVLAPLLFLIASLISDIAGAEVTDVAPNSPAAYAGLAVGDQLKRIGEHNIHSTIDVPEAIRSSIGKEVHIHVLRGATEKTLSATPRPNPPVGEGALGIRMSPVFEPAPLLVALPRAFERTVQAIGLLPVAIVNAVRGSQELELSSIVGIVDTVGQAARQGPETVFFLAALLTAQIGLINLFPWPGLDGGRLVFVGFEWLTGWRLPPPRTGG